jgi:hypothetical protein
MNYSDTNICINSNNEWISVNNKCIYVYLYLMVYLIALISIFYKFSYTKTSDERINQETNIRKNAITLKSNFN